MRKTGSEGAREQGAESRESAQTPDPLIALRDGSFA